MTADVAGTLRAAADVFLPSPPEDPTPGGTDIGADRFIEHYLESILPGLAEQIAGLLDVRAAELACADLAFAAATRSEREAVLDSFDGDEVAELRSLPQLLAMLTLGAMYGAWTGQDADGTLVREPVGWELTGTSGPNRGRRELLP